MQIGIGIGVSRFAGRGATAPAEPNPNLLLWSEEFDRAAWTKTGTTVTADQVNDPNEELTADLVDSNDILAARVTQVAPAAPVEGQTYTASVYFNAGPDAAGGAGLLSLADDAGGVASTTLESSLAADWVRKATQLVVQPGATTLTVTIRPDEDDGKSLYLWGAKLEEGPVATAYVKREGV